jgi:molybdate transport system ATP-binding protein
LFEVEIKRALAGFNLDIAFSVDGEVLGILGPSGSGKTMTLHCIAGLLKPDSGSIKLNDRVLFDTAKKINLPPKDRNVGMVFQNYALFPHLTAFENIGYGIRHHTKAEITHRVQTLIGNMELEGLQNRYPEQLSAGQQQRVAVARALAPEPDLLLLDEPFSALDSLTKEQLEMQILDLRRFYKGNIILVTHDLAEAYRLSSRIAVYEAGKIVQCASKERLISHPINQKVARLTRFRNFMDGVITGIDQKNVWVSIPELNTNLKVVANGHKQLAVNQAIMVGIRSEHVQSVPLPGQNTFEGTLNSCVENLASINCYFSLKNDKSGSRNLEAAFPKSAAPAFTNGANLFLYLPPEHIVIITDK